MINASLHRRELCRGLTLAPQCFCLVMPAGMCSAPSSILRQCCLPFPSVLQSLAAIYFAFAKREAKRINAFASSGAVLGISTPGCKG